MSHNNAVSPIVGSIIERKSTSASGGRPFSSTNISGSTSTGFPTVQHRSKSAFARNRVENLRRNSLNLNSRTPPVPISTRKSVPQPSPPSVQSPESDLDSWRDQISKDNEDRVAGMTEDEREEERRQIIERFGASISNVLEKARRNRMKGASETAANVNGRPKSDIAIPQPESDNTAWRNLQEVPISPEERRPVSRASPPTPALSTSSAASSRPSSRADRRIRFAELAPRDVYVYESTPPSPRRPTLALLPPTDSDKDAISLGQWHGRMATDIPLTFDSGSTELLDASGDTHLAEAEDQEMESPVNEVGGKMDVDPEEGTPEYIRRRYFPDLPSNDPNLAWMASTPNAGSSSSDAPSLRFDLHGAPIPPLLSSTLPSYLGLHHHAEGSHAGYTLDDIFLLSRSTVPAQRATMLGVLSGIANRLGKLNKGEKIDGMEGLIGKEEELRTRIVAAGVEGMNDRGSVGIRAIEVVWECLVGWDEEVIKWGVDGIQLEFPSDAAIRSISAEFIFSLIATTFGQHRESIPPESLLQLLGITERLALENTDSAQKIVTTDKLLPGLVQTFLLTPIPPPPDGSLLPEPSAISLLTTLANGSRANADALAKDYADALLRFITFTPSTSPFPFALATTLLTQTLSFYSALASYGFYSHIASTAMEPFSKLSQYILSPECSSRAVMSAWANLIQRWTVCAVDPHATTPSHDILWSRVVVWGWHSDLMQLSERLGCEDVKDWTVWGDIWMALAAWLEGCKLNAVCGGENERIELIAKVKDGFENDNGKERQVVLGVLDAVRHELAKPRLGASRSEMKLTSIYMDVLVAVIHLWLAFVPPHLEGPPSSPPFNLPFDRISAISASLLTNPVWPLSSFPSTLSPTSPPSPGTKEPSSRYRYNAVYIRHFSSFLPSYLCLSQRLPGIPGDLWLAQAFSIILRLMPGDEQLALDTINDLLKKVPSLQTIPGMTWFSKDGRSILEPFMQDLVMPRLKVDDSTSWTEDEGAKGLGPLIPTPKSIQNVATLTLASPSALGKKSLRSQAGLPLYYDWQLSSLDHLLHSGDSPVFRQLPALWDASETDVTRASFAFSIFARGVLNKFGLGNFTLSRGEAVLDCMKVFMLEHGLAEGNSKAQGGLGEVFRDKTVERLMGLLLHPYRIGAIALSISDPSESTSRIGNIDKEDLESLATRFLGFGTPFYQFYTDFLALYDSISFSHPLFGLLLLPPLSMHYPIDYRKLFWCDYSHVLRTISVYPDQVISGNLKEYFYPVETNSEVISGYLSALLQNTAKEFLRWVAVHHLAANIWMDLGGENEGGRYNEDRAGKLLKAIVDQGGHEVVRDVMRYHQPDSRDKDVLVPPNCFQGLESVLERRKGLVQKLVGDAYAHRLSGFT